MVTTIFLCRALAWVLLSALDENSEKNCFFINRWQKLCF
jgi:hypothetical protein